MANDIFGGALQIPPDLMTKLDQMDKRLESIALSSENMAKQFDTSLSAMAKGFDPVVNSINTLNTSLNNLDLSKLTIGLNDGLTNTSKKAEDATNSIVKMTSELAKAKIPIIEGDGQSSNTIESLKQKLKELKREAERIDLGEGLANTDKIQNANREIQNLDATIKRLQKTTSTTSTNDITSVMSLPESTINQRIAKVKELQRIQKDLDNTTLKGKSSNDQLNVSIRKLNAENAKAIAGSKELRLSHRRLMDTAGQLARRLALIFSISQIRNYINSMIEVRKNFELQQVSLQAIIQDKQEADKLFAQVTQLAVNSPYKIQELITYTKQMAAYRVETEKLYDTTKMLADVAAGVGIDMQRLILAYGQVKAANYLRGTELRQFSEAGINILGELAKKFSQVKGEIVSVGEVMAMISKRKVSFGDVENVFKTLTEDGGIFYNMQEKQAETLYGMVSNLRDSLDLMFNDIGKKQDSALKNAINLIKAMIDNWRTIAPIMTGILSTFLLYKGASFAVLTYQKISNTLLLAQGKAIKYAEAGQIAFNNAVKANPLILVLSTIVSIGLAIWQATSLAKNLNKELEKVRLTGLEEADESVRKFKQLADVVSDATSTYKEQQDALAELQRKYGDMLPTQTLTINGIRSLKGSYDEATASIYAYIDAKNKEERVEMVRSEYSTTITDAMTQAQEVLIKNFKLTKEEAKSVVSEIRNAINAGDIKTYDDFNNKLAELVSGIKGTTVSSKEFATVSSQITDRFSGMTSTASDANEEFKNLYITINKQKNAIDEVINSEGAYRDATRKRYDTQKDTTDKAIAQAKEYMNTISGLSGKETLTPIEQSQLNDAKAKLTAYYESIGKEAKDSKEYIENLSRGTVFVSQEAIRVAEIAYKQLADTIKGESESISKTKFLDDLQQQVDKLTGTSTTKQINDFILQFAKTNNLDLKGFEDILIGADETFDEYTTRFKEKAKELQETINQQSTGKGFLLYDPKYLENLKKILPMFEELSKKLAISSEGVKGTDKDPMEDIWKNRIKAIEDANKKYKELKKTMSDVEATTQTKELFRDVFKDANLDMDTYLNFDDNATMQSLEKLLPQLQKKFPKIATDLKRSLAEIKVDLVVDAKTEYLDKIQQQIDDLFSGYDLSLDLEKMGLDKNLIGDLFNIEMFNLDDLQAKLKPLLENLYQQGGESQIEAAKKTEEKITELQNKAIQERLKTYATYLRDSVSDRVQIELDYQKKIAEVMKNEEFTSPQKKVIREKLQVEQKTSIDKSQWEEFQNSDMYSMMFGDIESMGLKTIERLKENLIQLKDSLSSLPADQVKEIMTQINKLEEVSIKRNPFENMRESLSEINALKEKGRTEDFLQEELAFAELQSASYKEQIDAIDLIVNAKRSNISLDEQSVEWQEKYANWIGMSSNELDILRTILSDNLSISQQTSQTAQIDLAKYSKARKSLQAMSDEWSQIQSLSTSAYNSIKEVLESIGVESDSVAMTLADMGMSLLDLVGQAIMFGLQMQMLTVQAQLLGVAINTALGPIGWAVMAIQAIATIFKGIFNAGDKNNDRKIKKEEANIKSLEKAYKKLKEAIEDAYSIDTLKESNELAQKNIEETIMSYERKIAAEYSKKNKNWDNIERDYEAIEDLKEQQEELKKSMYETTGGWVENAIDAASSFMDAWYDAFKETGNGLSGLEDKFKETMLNIIKQQASLILVGPYIQNWKDELAKYFNEKDLELTKDEAVKWAETVKKDMPELAAALESFFKSLGGVVDTTSGELSGLQKGIQGVTETTAEALEALLNSMRFFVSDSNLQLKNIYKILSSNDETTNPMLAELRAQTIQVTAINRLLNSVVKGGNGGSRLKVEIL